MIWRYLTLLALVWPFLIPGGDGVAAADLAPLRVAILPLKNYTGERRAYDLAHKNIIRALYENGATPVASEELRSILRKHRIRSTGSISGLNGRKIAEAAAADLLLVGSIAFYDDVGYPQFGLSLRLIRSSDMKIISAVSNSATGRDYMGLFARGLVDRADSLVTRLANEIVSELISGIDNQLESDSNLEETEAVVVVPFENISRDRSAGSVAADWMVSELFASGYRVVEPGVVSDLLLNSGGVPAGEIDRPKMDQIRSEFNVTTIITGQVDTFRPARGVSLHSRPELNLGVRFIDTHSGNVIAMFETEKNGGDYSTVFGGGTCLSLGQLLEYALREAISETKIRTLQHALR